MEAMMRQLTCTLLVALALSGLGACTNFNETHLIKTIDPDTKNPINYFRLTVKGHAGLSAARYVAGCYDERAVDLFFNELRVSSESQTTNLETLFRDDLVSPGTNEKIQVLDACNEENEDNGTFVMILSTNADAVARTIGAFAESQVVADSITNLLGANRLKEAAAVEANLRTDQRRAKAVAAELTTLFAAVPQGAPPDAVSTEASYLAILNTITRALDSPQSFASLQAADEWLAGFKARQGAQP
jgi:hypothetical protein